MQGGFHFYINMTSIKHILILIAISICILNDIQAQRNEMVSSGGDYFKNNMGSISWTLGELSIETSVLENNILTQGMQQPLLEIMVTSIIESLDNEIKAFPNPTDGLLYLKTTFSGGMSYQVFNLLGNDIDHGLITQSESLISLNNLDPGIYLIKVVEGQSVIKILRIIKK